MAIALVIEHAGARTIQVNDRGVEYAEQGRYDQAICGIHQVSCRKIQIYGIAYYNRGTAYARLGQPDLAIADFSKVYETK